MGTRWYVGDAQSFTTQTPEFPASAGWTLKYRLTPRPGGAGTAFTLTSTPTGDDHRIDVTSAVSAAWVPDEYACIAWVENGAGEKHTVDPQIAGERGDTALNVTLLPDPRTSTAYDGRSPARKALDAIDAALETFGSKAFVAEYSIGNRMMRFNNQADLIEMRSRLAAEVWREEAAAKMAAGLPNPRNISVRFV